MTIPNLKDEIWKDIKGFVGLYQVSNKGRVKHLQWKKPMCANDGTTFYVDMPESLVKNRPQFSRDGKRIITYYTQLSKRYIQKGKNKSIRTKRKIISRITNSLVAEYFMKDRPNFNDKVKLINVDGDLTNSNIDNLKYIEHYQNIRARKDLVKELKND